MEFNVGDKIKVGTGYNIRLFGLQERNGLLIVREKIICGIGCNVDGCDGCGYRFEGDEDLMGGFCVYCNISSKAILTSIIKSIPKPKVIILNQLF